MKLIVLRWQICKTLSHFSVGLLFNDGQQNNQTDNPEELKAILTGYFDGTATMDFQKMIDLTTGDFALFEDGKVFNNDSLIKEASKYPNFKAEYKFDNLIINID